MDVATIGDNCIDRYGPPIGLSTVGGNALNVAVTLARLGRRVAYFGAIGTDDAGARVSACLIANGVSVEHLCLRAGMTAYTDLAVDGSGERTITYEEFGVCRGYRPSPAEIEILRQARHVHLGWLDDAGATKRALAAAGVSLSQDLAVNAGADDLAIAFASAGPSRERARSLLAKAQGKGVRLVVVTMGVLGSMASDGVRYAEAGIVPVEAVDTTGAGDTFIAAFLDAHLRGQDLAACLAAGRDAAAATCGHLGAIPQEPLPFEPTVSASRG